MIKKKPVLGLDLDGVTYEWEKTARKLLKIYFGHKIPPSVGWDSIKQTIPPADWKWLWADGVKYGLFRHGHVISGAIEALREIEKDFRVEVITSRPEAAWQDTRDWVAFHKIPAASIHLLGPLAKKSLVPADVYVDDKTSNIEELMANSKGEVIVFDQPWNQDALAHHRVKGWGELQLVLSGFARRRAA